MKAVLKKALSLVMAVMCVFSFGNFPTVKAADEKDTLIWPVPGHYEVTQWYIETPDRSHNGIDILDSNISGATVRAAMGGTVKKVFKCTLHHETSVEIDCYGYGTCVVIYGDDGRSYVYAHLLGGSVPENVYEGAHIDRGNKIGQVGNTGYSYAAHLHFVVSKGDDFLKNTIDPMSLIYEEHPNNATKFTAAGVNYPLHLKSGDSFDARGTFFSPNNIIYGEAQVLDTSHNVVISNTINQGDVNNVVNLSDFVEKGDFSSLPDGSYRYFVYVVDEKGYSANINKTFTVGTGESTTDTVDILNVTHNCSEERVDAVYKWDEGVITAEPSCWSVGVNTYTCKECGNTKTVEIPKTEHDFQSSWTVDSEATSKSVGYKSRHCNNCDATTDVTEIPIKDNMAKVWIILITLAVIVALFFSFVIRKKKAK